MAASKKLRFEIFKRDEFRCQYCGKVPPEAILHLDHVIPKKEGGGDGEENLITSCRDCNLGKGARLLGKKGLPGGHVRKLSEGIREREDQLREYNELLEEQRMRIDDEVYDINLRYSELEDGYELSDFGKLKYRNLLRTFSKFSIIEAMEITWMNKPELNENSKFSYLCGILWTKRRQEWQEDA